MADGKAYQDVSLQPNWRQLLIDEGLSILGALALLVAGGLDGVPAHTLLLCLGLALVVKVCYRLLYLRRMEYTITGEQLVYEHGVFSRSRTKPGLHRALQGRRLRREAELPPAAAGPEDHRRAFRGPHHAEAPDHWHPGGRTGGGVPPGAGFLQQKENEHP